MYKVQAIYLPRPGMTFDYDYYFAHHVPLARKQNEGRTNIKKLEVETDVTLLMNEKAVISPLVFSAFFETRDDLDAFRAFLMSEHADPLRADVAKYTNCEIEWRLAELHEV